MKIETGLYMQTAHYKDILLAIKSNHFKGIAILSDSPNIITMF